MDWKNFFPMCKWSIWLLPLLILLSCGKKSDESQTELPFFTGISPISEMMIVTDSAAMGFGEGWYRAEAFPLSQAETKQISRISDPDYYHWGFMSFPVGAVDTSKMLLLETVELNGEMIIWINDRLLTKSDDSNNGESAAVQHFLKSGSDNVLIFRLRGSNSSLPALKALKIGAPIAEKIDTSAHEAEALPEPNTASLPYIQPDSHKDIILYELFLRNFTPNGTFNGLQYRVDYVHNLGMNTIWLMPIHPIGEVRRKGSLGSPYSVRAYFLTNPDMGSKEQFKEMLDEVHKKGMKLIIDAVANHTAWDNGLVYTNPEYFTKDKDGNIIHPEGTDWTDVADLDYSNPNVRNFMQSYFDYWLTEMGIDGFRCDVSEMMPMDFWNTAIRNLREKRPEIFMLAEGTESANLENGFNAVYSWDLYYAFQEIHGGADPALIYKTLRMEELRYPNESLVMHYAENHDTERAAKTLGIQQHHLALITIFTAPGIPMIYSGQELGETERMDIFEKKALNFNRRVEPTFQMVKKLAALRSKEAALRRGELLPLPESWPSGGYLRSYQGDTLTVLLNYHDDDAYYNLASDEALIINAESRWTQTAVRLSPKGYLVAAKRKN
jgi:cyclomaltodextrinase / maltogenic alpha-amylase / neopullulanase